MVYRKKLFLVITASLVWFGLAMVAPNVHAQCPNGNCKIASKLPTRLVIQDLKPQPPKAKTVKKPYQPFIRWKR